MNTLDPSIWSPSHRQKAIPMDTSPDVTAAGAHTIHEDGYLASCLHFDGVGRQETPERVKRRSRVSWHEPARPGSMLALGARGRDARGDPSRSTRPPQQMQPQPLPRKEEERAVTFGRPSRVREEDRRGVMDCLRYDDSPATAPPIRHMTVPERSPTFQHGRQMQDKDEFRRKVETGFNPDSKTELVRRYEMDMDEIEEDTLDRFARDEPNPPPPLSPPTYAHHRDTSGAAKTSPHHPRISSPQNLSSSSSPSSSLSPSHPLSLLTEIDSMYTIDATKASDIFQGMARLRATAATYDAAKLDHLHALQVTQFRKEELHDIITTLYPSMGDHEFEALYFMMKAPALAMLKKSSVKEFRDALENWKPLQ